MAVLPSVDRAEATAETMRQNQQPWPAACLKTHLRTSVDSLDTWLDQNATQINNQFPAAVRSVLTPEQKARLFIAVVRRRYLAD
jgi:hypothetical protein